MKKIMFMLAVVTSMALPMIAEQAAPAAPASTNKVEKAKCEAPAKVEEKAAVAQ